MVEPRCAAQSAVLVNFGPARRKASLRLDCREVLAATSASTRGPGWSVLTLTSGIRPSIAHRLDCCRPRLWHLLKPFTNAAEDEETDERGIEPGQ